MKQILINILTFILKNEAKIIMAKFHPEVLAITGSIAKTSTKEAIGTILESKFGKAKIRKSPGNLNNKLGVPLAILGFQRTPSKWLWPYICFSGLLKAIFSFSYPKILVLEIAADKPGEMAEICSYIKPKIAVVTAVGPAHLEFFGNLEGLVKEKSCLIWAVPKDGFVVLNQADERVKEMAQFSKAPVRYFSGYGMNIARKAAVACAQIYKIKKKESEKILSSMKSLPGRANIFEGIKRTKIIDDSYNANPLSMANALDFLKNFPGKRKIAILGDMLELGQYSNQAHQEVGKLAKQKADKVIAIGPKSKMMKAHFWFPSKEKAIAFLLEEIVPGDIILIKASRKMGLEKIVEALREEKWR